jgi:hypothetical protein
MPGNLMIGGTQHATHRTVGMLAKEMQVMDHQQTDRDREAYQRDQAEGERNDAKEEAVTRGPHGADESTRQQSVAEREPAEGGKNEVGR